MAVIDDRAIRVVNGNAKNIKSDELWEYLEEAFKFSNLRKFNFSNMNENEAEFLFDFVKGDKTNFNTFPNEIRKNVKICHFGFIFTVQNAS